MPLPHSLLPLDQVLERLVNFRPSSRNVAWWQGLIATQLVAAFWVRVSYGGCLSVDLFLPPVLLSAALFRNRGLVAVCWAALGYLLGGLLCQEIDNRHILLNTLGQVLEWSLLAGFALVTLDRYSAIKKLQAAIQVDVELARRLQTALMQNRFDLGSLKLRGKVSQTLAVGGDFFYFRPFGQKYVVFCLGDVMGKGISASLQMALVMGFMFEWGKKSPSPSFVLKKLNQRLSQWSGQQGGFITMVYGVYDEEQQSLSYANAGHPAALLLRQYGALEHLNGTGLPLGVLEESDWEERSIPLVVGDRLLLFSDEVLEARSPQREEFGQQRLEETYLHLQTQPIEAALETIEARVRNHCQGHLNDDLALLMIERSN